MDSITHMEVLHVTHSVRINGDHRQRGPGVIASFTHGEELFPLDFEHKYVKEIHVGEQASVIHPPDRCGISGCQLNSTGVPWVGDNVRPL